MLHFHVKNFYISDLMDKKMYAFYTKLILEPRSMFFIIVIWLTYFGRICIVGSQQIIFFYLRIKILDLDLQKISTLFHIISVNTFIGYIIYFIKTFLIEYFVNIGPQLATNISRPESYNYTLINRNQSIMLLSHVEQNEVIDIVLKCKNKSIN